MESTLFNSLDADLVLRSTAPSLITFRLHRCILATSSPFFEHMFTLPQPDSASCSTPTVEVSESGEVLEKLLQIIYPMPNPVFDSLEELTPVLEAACKYDVTAAIDVLRTLLVGPAFVERDPLRVYAIASRFDLEDAAKVASRHTLEVNILDAPLSDDLRYISAYQYHRLLGLHRSRAKAAQELLVLHGDVKCMMCNGTHYGRFIPPKWWKDFEERARKELSLRPTTVKIFSMPFLAESARVGCERCAVSIFEAQWFLNDLKKSIDDLPSTI